MRLREQCFMFIASHQPVSQWDLRLVFSLQHIVLELEQMADHAVYMARAAIRLNPLPPLRPDEPLREMAAPTQAQVVAILEAVVEADEGLAREIAARDDTGNARQRIGFLTRTAG